MKNNIFKFNYMNGIAYIPMRLSNNTVLYTPTYSNKQKASKITSNILRFV